jgi:hypothetical protein
MIIITDLLHEESYLPTVVIKKQGLELAGAEKLT